jgi:hypothetical protein
MRTLCFMSCRPIKSLQYGSISSRLFLFMSVRKEHIQTAGAISLQLGMVYLHYVLSNKFGFGLVWLILGPPLLKVLI